MANARKPSRRSRREADTPPLDVRVMNGAAALLFAAAVLVLAWAAVKWATRSPVFTVRAISLDASLQRTNLATVRANALPRLAGNFFSVDLDATRAAFESVPWVRRAVVRRVWPDRLAVTLEEHEAAALWQGEGGAERLVNTHGEIFEANLGDVEDEALPILAGPDTQSAPMLAMLRRLGVAMARLSDPVQTLHLSSRGSWRVELDGGATLELGRGTDDEVVARVDRFMRTFGSVTARFGGAPRALVTADLRHPDGYALRLAGISTATKQ
ncbi:MAG: cell division protein FtsQ/DivIB [Aquincola sp.]|nr:cell division protein FtsQ/DivIB [Aquincola sp.]